MRTEIYENYNAVGIKMQHQYENIYFVCVSDFYFFPYPTPNILVRNDIKTAASSQFSKNGRSR